MALVADGPERTFLNEVAQHNLAHLFDSCAISELVGCEKPDRRMFEYSAQPAWHFARRLYTRGHGWKQPQPRYQRRERARINQRLDRLGTPPAQDPGRCIRSTALHH